MKKQVIFDKGGRLRFVGHLDMMRLLQRALNRADIALTYSQGFNPHPHMSFAAPLPLGWYGTGEIMELDLEEELSNEELVFRLNEQLPDGIRMLFCRDLESSAPAIMSLVRAASYDIVLPSGHDLETSWNEFIAQDEILLTKKGKIHGHKTEKQVNVRPFLLAQSLRGSHLKLIACCGGEQNLKPDGLIWKFYESVHLPLEQVQYTESITRTAFLGTEEDAAGKPACYINYSAFPEVAREQDLAAFL